MKFDQFLVLPNDRKDRQVLDTTRYSLDELLLASGRLKNAVGERRHRQALLAMSVVCWIRCVLVCHGSNLHSLACLVELAPERSIAELAGRKGKFYGYAAGMHSPSPSLVARIDAHFEGTRQFFAHVVWEVLTPKFETRREWEACLQRLHPDVLHLVVRKDPLGFGRFLTCERKVLIRRLPEIERCASLDAIACLVILMKQATVNGDQELAFLLGYATCRALLFAGEVLTSLGVAQPLADFIDEYVLPLASHKGRSWSFGATRYSEAIEAMQRLVAQREELKDVRRDTLRLRLVDALCKHRDVPMLIHQSGASAQ